MPAVTVDPVEVVRRHGDTLVAIAEQAIRVPLTTGEVWEPALTDLPPALQAPGASFVTLEEGDRLLGCIGSLEAVDPLAVDVARRARAAAFADPRFPPIGPDQFVAMTITVSVLSRPEPLDVAGRDELLAVLRPGVDGLLIQAGWHRATFLPSVWAKVADTEVFLDALWWKAGLAPRTWPVGLRVARYTTATVRGDPPRPLR